MRGMTGIERRARPDRIKDLTRERFGSWTVVSYYGRKVYGKSHAQYWEVRCDCGEERVVQQASFKGGTSTQCTVCGHGEPDGWTHELYRTWLTMKNRCSNPKHPDYEYYGARGVKVCNKWRQSFKAFLADMGERPTPDLTLDRINNNGDYEPGNVRWADHATQRANQRPRQPYGPRVA